VILGLYVRDGGSNGLLIKACDPHYSRADGWIYCTKARAHEEWGKCAKALKQAEECLKSEVETYSQYLEGDVYGYVVSVPDDEDEDADGEELDSCWGLFGMDYCVEEAKDRAASCAERRNAADVQ
jgi:hypothetical protein